MSKLRNSPLSRPYSCGVLDYDKMQKQIKVAATFDAISQHIQREWVEYSGVAAQGLKVAKQFGDMVAHNLSLGFYKPDPYVGPGEDTVILESNRWKATARRLEKKYWQTFMDKLNTKGIAAGLNYFDKIIRLGKTNRASILRLVMEVQLNNELANDEMSMAIRKFSNIKMAAAVSMAILGGAVSIALLPSVGAATVIGVPVGGGYMGLGAAATATAASTAHGVVCSVASSWEQAKASDALLLKVGPEDLGLMGVNFLGGQFLGSVENNERAASAGVLYPRNAAAIDILAIGQGGLILLSALGDVLGAVNEHEARMDALDYGGG